MLAFIAGGVGGAAVGCLVGFYGLYGTCWVLSWLAGNQNYMHLMWVGMLIVPMLGLMGLVGGGAVAALWAGGRIETAHSRGFDVSDADGGNAG